MCDVFSLYFSYLQLFYLTYGCFWKISNNGFKKKVERMRSGHGCSGAILLGWESCCGASRCSCLIRLREEQKGWTLNHSLEANCWCRPRPGTRLPNRVQGCDGGSPMTPFSLAKKWGDPTSMPILSTGTNHFLQFKERGPPPVRGHLPTGFGSHWATPACLGCFHQQLYLLTLLII